MPDDTAQLSPELLDQISKAAPTWMSDGLGVRGYQVSPSYEMAPNWGSAVAPESQPFDFGGQQSSPQGGGGGVGGSGTIITPFLLLPAADNKIRVVYGTVNSIVPDLMSAGDSPACLVTPVGASGFVCLKATLDTSTFLIDALTIVVNASTMPEDSDPYAYYQIGSYAITDGVMTLAQAATTSLAYIRAGYFNLWGS